MESGAETPAEEAREEEEGDGQDEDVELLEGRELDPVHISVAVAAAADAPPTLCGDSSLISIWFFLGPVEMFWMLNWLKDDDSGPAADDDEEDEEEDEEQAWEDAACRMEGGWGVVGELIGM